MSRSTTEQSYYIQGSKISILIQAKVDIKMFLINTLSLHYMYFKHRVLYLRKVATQGL